MTLGLKQFLMMLSYLPVCRLKIFTHFSKLVKCFFPYANQHLYIFQEINSLFTFNFSVGLLHYDLTNFNFTDFIVYYESQTSLTWTL